MMKINYKKIILIIIAIFLAKNTFAVTFSEVAIKLSDGIIYNISMLAFSAGFVFFLWGIFIFVLSEAGTSKRQEGLNKIIYSVFAIFVMVSLWAIVSFFTNSLDLNNKPIREIRLDGSKKYGDTPGDSWNRGGVHYGPIRDPLQ